MPTEPPGNPGRNRRPQGKRPHSRYGDKRGKPTTHAAPPPVPGYDLRALAVRLVSAVLDRGRALDDALSTEFASGAGAALEPRDRALARLIATTVLRHKGELETVVATFIDKPLPADRGLLTPILLCAAAQLLILNIAPHAVLNIAVDQARRDRGARRFDRLTNAVLRRTCERGREILATLTGARANVPDWMWARWVAAYGEDTAARIAEASLQEPVLDLTVNRPSETSEWATRLGGQTLQTGTIRVANPSARVNELPGFAEGAWWVQDAAAALPARLFGDVRGLRVADLCAAPGGKSAQLAAAGAIVTAVDLTPDRLKRVHENFARLQLEAEVVAADVLTWTPAEKFDAVLLDAPCTATGTIRRHPDILHLKRAADMAQLVDLQARLLDRALSFVRPGGIIVYCTCSLEPEEGEGQVRRLLERHSSIVRVPLTPEVGIDPAWITADGDLRTLPFHTPGSLPAHGGPELQAAEPPNPTSPGMDGFYAARLRV